MARIKSLPRPVILHFVQVITPPVTKDGVTVTMVDAAGIIDSAADNAKEDDEGEDSGGVDGDVGMNYDASGPIIVDVDIADEVDDQTNNVPRHDRCLLYSNASFNVTYDEYHNY